MNSKVLKIVVAIIAVIGLAGFVMVSMADKNTPEMTSAVNFIVDFAFFLLIAVVFVAIVLSLLSLIKKPATLKKTLLGIVILGVVFAISYFTASDATVFDANGLTLLEAGSVSKWSGAGLTFSLVLLTIGGLFFVIDLLRGLVKS